MITRSKQFLSDQVYIYRDDIYPSYYGGNKARKIDLQLNNIRQKSANAIITTGGIQSNHCRVVALMCALYGWQCHLILHGNKKRFETENGNAAIIRATGAKVSFVKSSGISDAMDKAMSEFREQDLNPFYLYGGGHTIEGAMAYAEAVGELKHYCIKNDWFPDHIVLASGTGSTQAGIIAGLHIHEMPKTRVTGISIARNWKRGNEAISKLLSELNESKGYHYDYSESIHFNDDYLFGGYEKTNKALDSFVEKTIMETGIIFDTTYSGKALYGMSNLIEKGALEGNILFWHTGGIFNYLAKQ